MRFYRLQEDSSRGYTVDIQGTHRWGLPGVICPECKATWGDNSRAYPSVDLTPVASLADFETPRPEPIEEYERLSELVRPLLPPGTLLEPGCGFGPLEGTVQGSFGALVCPIAWWPMIRREALEQLQAEGVRGLHGCRHALRFRRRNPPDLLELQVLPMGRMHPECLPPDKLPLCPRCHRFGVSLPQAPLLDATTLRAGVDVFRLEDFSTVVVCSERFVSACHRLELDGARFTPLPVR